jgi:hypothetical protein
MYKPLDGTKHDFGGYPSSPAQKQKRHDFPSLNFTFNSFLSYKYITDDVFG